MRGAVLYGPRDVRFEERDAPTIIKPTDAVIRISATCVCGSDLWPIAASARSPNRLRWGTNTAASSRRSAVPSPRSSPGQFAIGSFFASDNTCPHCQAGYQTSCQHKEFISTAQAPMLSVPFADGTLVAAPDVPSEDLIPQLAVEVHVARSFPLDRPPKRIGRLMSTSLASLSCKRLSVSVTGVTSMMKEEFHVQAIERSQ